VTVVCEWCGQQMTPPFEHLDFCPRMNVRVVAERIERGGEFVDAEARRVATELLRVTEAA
jgi:hypothetical protein